MSSLATRRLIEASSVLEPADRALLNLWVHRGLDDARLAALTGMGADAVATRRARIVTQLSEALGLPEPDIATALSALEPGDGVAPGNRIAPGNGDGPNNGDAPGADASAAGDVPDPSVDIEPAPEVEPSGQEAQPQLESYPAGPAVAAEDRSGETPPARRLRAVPPLPPEAPPPPSPPAAAEDRPPRRWWAAIAGVIILAIAVTLAIVLLSSGSSTPAPRASSTPTTMPAPTASSSTAPSTTTATTTAAGPGSPTSTSRTAAASAGASGAAVGAAGTRLAAFPGGLKSTTGDVVLSGHSPHLKLKLTVKGLPAPNTGHYEVWLFSSVVNDRRLGRMASGSTTVTFPLPRGARHYRWIDVTLQPKGSHSYSGESKLRAHNPVDGPRSVLHAHRARVPKPLTHARQGAGTHHRTASHRVTKRRRRSSAQHGVTKHHHASPKHKPRPAGRRRTAAHS